MRGSVVNQVQTVFKSIIHFGESKHEAKMEARENGAKTWHDVGKNIGIYSYATADSYRQIAIEAFSYIRENFNIKDITKIESQHINSYLESKIESNVKYSTFQKHSSAMEKLQVALEKYTNQKYDFDLSESRELAQNVLERTDAHRAYGNPKAVISALSNQTFKVIAQAQLESGARVHELNNLKLSQFKENGSITVQGKGGKIRDLELSEKTYSELKSLVENSQDKKLVFSTDAYRNELKAACKVTNQEYQGTHGLRWSYAQSMFAKLQQSGKTYEESLSIVSQKLGHERSDITEHYLR
jgi:integrase